MKERYSMGPWAPCDICGGQTRCRVADLPRIEWVPRHMACEAEQDAARQRRHVWMMERRPPRRPREGSMPPTVSHTVLGDVLSTFVTSTLSNIKPSEFLRGRQ